MGKPWRQGAAQAHVRRVELMKTEREKLRADKQALQRMLDTIEFTPMETSEATSRIAVEFYNVGKAYIEDGRHKTILDKFYLRIQRGDRIGIVGRNGSGKTTFLKLLLGELKPETGKVKLARDIATSYFDQKRKDLHPEHSLHRILCPNGSDYIDVMGKTRHVCGYLKDFCSTRRRFFIPLAPCRADKKTACCWRGFSRIPAAC